MKNNKNICIRQHYIPASHIGRFSFDTDKYLRERKVWVMRNDIILPFKNKAENVGFIKNIYPESIDQSWGGIEANLSQAIEMLEKSKTNIFDLSIWATILIPFIAQLFVRGMDYFDDIFKRADPLFKNLGWNDNKIKDNINGTRLIDYQVFCGLLITAEWRLLYNYSDTPFILNDRGYCLFIDTDAEIKGFAIPLTPRILLKISDKTDNYVDLCGKISEEPSAIYLERREISKDEIESFNTSMAVYSRNEIYGQTKNIVLIAWENHNKGNFQNLFFINPYFLFNEKKPSDHIYEFYKFLKFLKYDLETIKSAMGGNFIIKNDTEKGGSFFLTISADMDWNKILDIPDIKKYVKYKNPYKIFI